MRKKLIYLLVLLCIVCLALIPVAVIAWNSAPIFSNPGVLIRLKTYLTTNVAETKNDSMFPELVTPVYDMSAMLLWEKLKQSMQQLQWDIHEINEDKKEIHAVVTTPLFQFKDDVLIRIEELEDGKCELYIRSSSRVGKGDLGKNTEHILSLCKEIASHH